MLGECLWNGPLALWKCHTKRRDAIMTSSNGNIFRVTSRSPVNSPHKRQWCGALIFSFICVFINDWVNNRKTADLRRYRTHYDGTVIALGPISYRALKSNLLGHSLLWLRKWVPLFTQNVISRLETGQEEDKNKNKARFVYIVLRICDIRDSYYCM